MNKLYFVYILGNEKLTLYIGVTSNLARRIYEHKKECADGFTKKYKLKKLSPFAEDRERKLADECEESSASEGFCSRRSRGEKIPRVLTRGASLYYEVCSEALVAIEREKKLKNWHRDWKLNLIKKNNPNFEDLYEKILK